MLTELITRLGLGYLRVCFLFFLLLFSFLFRGFFLRLLHGCGLHLGVVTILEERSSSFTCFLCLFRQFFLFFNLLGCRLRLGLWRILIVSLDFSDESDEVVNTFFTFHLVIDGDSCEVRGFRDLIQTSQATSFIKWYLQMEDVLHQASFNQLILMFLFEGPFATELRLKVDNDDKLVVTFHLIEELLEVRYRHRLLIFPTARTQSQRFLESFDWAGLFAFLWSGGTCSALGFFFGCRGFRDFRLFRDGVNADLLEIVTEEPDKLFLLLEIICNALTGKLLLLLSCGTDTTCRHLCRQHE